MCWPFLVCWPYVLKENGDFHPKFQLSGESELLFVLAFYFFDHVVLGLQELVNEPRFQIIYFLIHGAVAERDHEMDLLLHQF